MKKRLTYVIPILMVIGGLIWWFAAKPGQAAAPFRMGVVDRGTIKLAVTATGTASAVTTVAVGSQVSGTIREIYVDFNSPVKKGQVLARLDPTFLQATVSENEANLEKANAALNQAQRDLDRTTDLAAKNLVAQVELDNAQTALESARASVRQAEAALQRARVNLQYAVITSPINGVVVSRDIDVGQTVAASLQAPQLFTIAQDLRQMQIETNIDEADIGRLEEGMDASFTVDSYPEEQFHAQINQIRYAAVEEQSVVTYPVILKVDNPDLKLRPGMTANVTIITAERDDALRLPAAALRFRPANYKPERGNNRADSVRAQPNDGERKRRGNDSTAAEGAQAKRSRPSTVFVKNDGEALPRTVTIGLNDGSFVEIVSGEVEEGDSVIVGLAGTSFTGQRSNMPGVGGGPRR